MFNTYVINLKKDRERWVRIYNHLKEHNIKPIRFNAIYGKKLKKKEYSEHITKKCQIFCPDSVKGCGLSHILLSKYLYNNDKNEFALVLEDDAFSKTKNLKKRINNIIKQVPKDWEIIMLYCQGKCDKTKQYNRNKIVGGMVAYLINKKGQKKISNLKLSTHIDMQIYLLNHKKIKTYHYRNNLFDTPIDNISNNKNNNSIYNIFDNIDIGLTHKPSFYCKFYLLKNPITKKNITFGEILLYCISFILIFSLLFIKYR